MNKHAAPRHHPASLCVCSWQPDADVRALGRALVGAGGADVVFGHGSHHIQGVEVVGERRVPIIYGAGKFMDDYKVRCTCHTHQLTSSCCLELVTQSVKCHIAVVCQPTSS